MPERKPRTQRSGEVADLFKVLRYMGADPDVSEAHFRIAFAISQFVNASTGWAIISDDALEDWLPRTSSKKLRLFRRAIEKSGWMETIEGERGRPTRYLFLDTLVPEHKKRLADASSERDAEYALSKSREQSGAKAAAHRAQIEAEAALASGQLRGKSRPLNSRSKGGNLCLNKGAILPPLLPQSSTSPEGYRKQDVAEDARTPLPTPALLPARADISPPECDADALRAELLDRQLPRSHSGEFQCIDCGTETRLAARYKSEPFNPHCPDCIEANAFPDVKPIAGQPSYAEASRGE